MASGEIVPDEVCAKLGRAYGNKVITVPMSETVLRVALVMLFFVNRVRRLLIVR